MRRRALLAASQSTDTDTTYENEYFTVESLIEETTFSVNTQIKYSLNRSSWVTASANTNIILSSNDRIRISTRLSPATSDVYRPLRISGSFNVSGNIMSLLYGDDFIGQTIISNPCALAYLFYKCTGLVSAENLILPATELTTACYAGMFEGCTNMIKAPLLPATKTSSGCYKRLFYGCSKINYIKMLATDAYNYALSQWVYGVSPTGTFIKNPEATWDVRGDSGVPEGWTIKFDGEEDLEPYDRVFKIYDEWTQISENEYYFTIEYPSEAIFFLEKAEVVLNKYGKTQQTGNTIVKYCENVPSSFNVTVDGIRMKELRFTYIDSNFQYATMEVDDGNVNISMEVDSESFTLYKSLY